MAERPEDLNLPNAVVGRIIKEALPTGVIVSKDARLAISKAASVFVLYATSCANNVAMQSKRKTITGSDVIKAMSEMEFDRFVEPLETSHSAWKNDQKGKKAASEAKKAAKLKEKEKTEENIIGENEGNDDDNTEDKEGSVEMQIEDKADSPDSNTSVTLIDDDSS